MTTVIVRERYQTFNRRNPISGHEWTERGQTTGYEAVGALGVVSVHTKPDRAEGSRAEWQGFFDKFSL